MAIWVVSVFMTLSGFYFGAALTLSRLMMIKEHSLLVLPLAPVIYFLSLVPDNITEVYDLLYLFSLYLGIPFGFIFPTGLYILARVRGLKPEKGGDDGKTTFKGR
jgi:spore germination protein